MKTALAALPLVAVLASALPASSQEVERTYASPQSIIAATSTVPAGSKLVFLSGALPDAADPTAERGTIAYYGDTETQTASVLSKIEATLKAQGLGLGDVVSMTVYLVGDPANDGRMDFAGMMRAYGKHFGTTDQPHRPSRSTVQVAALAAPGFLVEIEVTAAKAPSSQ
ncbi:RidA family protein [Brevundimonas sp.]|jgi:enamine deaminase RidA (YjgF/YER057c/UK114 family)|uniref:RidA family protein n=1 Tax=Brevundimonas sp. TaxID=1871086 RepID=UPI0037C10CD8